MIESIPPHKLGMPPSYTEWRPSQISALTDILDDDSRFTVIQAPVGMGKSGIGIALAKLTGYRSVYLTFTKALQDQLLNDFSQAGLKLIKGRSNYKCIGSPLEQFDCETWAPFCRECHCPYGRHNNCNALDCDGWSGECPYRLAYQDAARSSLIVANYAYWVNVQRAANSGLHTDANPVDLLILDEAHAAPDGLCDLLSVTFSSREIKQYANGRYPAALDSMEAWRDWARQEVSAIAAETSSLNDAQVMAKATAQRLRERNAYIQKLGSVLNTSGQWAIEPEEKPRRWSLKPVYAYEHAEGRLFCGVKKVLIMSGTVTRKTVAMLGLGVQKYTWHAYPYLFPKAHAPIYWVKTAQINHRTPPEGIERLYRTTANIMRKRADRSGIIHTVSYKRAQEFVEWLAKYDQELFRMTLTHNSTNTAYIVKTFKESKVPRVLVSPSVTTGYDFPQQECEYVVWLKLPFPMMKTPVMEARAKNDKTYSGYLMIQELVQGIGRGMRSASDFCESFLLDDSWTWAGRRYSSFIPSWVKVQSRDSVPPPPPSIRARLAA